MGYSVRAAVGAKLARPDYSVVALAGDGAFLMTGLEFMSAAQLELGVMVRGMGVDFIALSDDQGVKGAVGDAGERAAAGRTVIVDVAIDYTEKTHFTRGIVKTNLHRLPLRDRVRFITRAVGRRFIRR